MAAKILLTGRPGVGKTTVIEKVLASGIHLAGGFWTEEIRQQGRRVGFRITDVYSRQEAVLAHVERRGRPRVGKYGVDLAAMDRIGVGALRESLQREGCVVIDEIGKMELCSKAFREVVQEVLSSDRPVLATIPVYRHPLLDRLRRRDDVTLIEMTTANRDQLPGRIVDMLGGITHKGS